MAKKKISLPKLASTIIHLDECLRELKEKGLNRKAIIVLLHDATKLPKRQIEYVINAIEELETIYGEK